MSSRRCVAEESGFASRCLTPCLTPGCSLRTRLRPWSSPARRPSSRAPRAASAPRPCASCARRACASSGGARRVERIDADLALPLDVTDEASCVEFVDAAVEELGGIDILYNNAGLALGRYPFTESTPEDEATVLHTNVDGAIRITRLALPYVRDEGHILFTGSIAGRQAYQNAAVYVAAKFALRGFVYGLREDLLGRPIRITTVDPGLSKTEFSLVRFKGDAEAAEAPYVGVDPLTADDVAECVLFTLTRPLHVNVDEIVIKALAQSSGGRILRSEA